MACWWENLLFPFRDDKNLSAQQIMLVNWVMEAGEVPLQEFVGQIDDLRELMSRGLLRLKISMHVWGIQYLVTSPKAPLRHDLEVK